MDSVPSTSTTSPTKKRKASTMGHLSLIEKQTIINMLNDHFTSKTVKIDKIVTTIGIAVSTVYRTIQEYQSTGTVTTSPHSGGRPGLIDSFDEFAKSAEQRLVHGFFFRNEMPTMDKVQKELKNQPDLPQMSRSSLYKFMKQINFRYFKRSCNSILIERDDIVTWIVIYLRSIKKFRSEHCPIYYLDETWVNEGHTTQKVWVDESTVNRRDVFLKGLSTGLKNPSEKGKGLFFYMPDLRKILLMNQC